MVGSLSEDIILPMAIAPVEEADEKDQFEHIVDCAGKGGALPFPMNQPDVAH